MILQLCKNGQKSAEAACLSAGRSDIRPSQAVFEIRIVKGAKTFQLPVAVQYMDIREGHSQGNAKPLVHFRVHIYRNRAA